MCASGTSVQSLPVAVALERERVFVHEVPSGVTHPSARDEFTVVGAGVACGSFDQCHDKGKPPAS